MARTVGARRGLQLAGERPAAEPFDLERKRAEQRAAMLLRESA